MGAVLRIVRATSVDVVFVLGIAAMTPAAFVRVHTKGTKVLHTTGGYQGCAANDLNGDVLAGGLREESVKLVTLGRTNAIRHA